MASQTFMTRAGQQPALAVILAIAGVIGFGIGTWLGNGTKPATASAVEPTPSIVATSSALPSPPSIAPPTPSAEPTQSLAPTSTPAAPQEVIFSIEGTTHDVTDSFKAKPGWQIQWQIEGEAIAIAVSGDPNLGLVIDQKGPASGVTSPPQGGTFRLQVTADGPWSITVIQGTG